MGSEFDDNRKKNQWKDGGCGSGGFCKETREEYKIFLEPELGKREGRRRMRKRKRKKRNKEGSDGEEETDGRCLVGVDKMTTAIRYQA